jgi:hypothetical protein
LACKSSKRLSLTLFCFTLTLPPLFSWSRHLRATK